VSKNSGNAILYADQATSKTNWVGAVYINTASDRETTNTTAYDAIASQSAWLVDASATSVRLQVSTVDVFWDATADAYQAISLTGDSTVDINILKSSLSTTRATELGVTLDVKKEGTPTMPDITFSSAVTSATGGNGENYSNTTANALSYTVGNAGASVDVQVTTYDAFTLNYGGNSVTATLVIKASAGYVSGADAAAAVATTLAEAWGAKYGVTAADGLTAVASGALSFWMSPTGSSGTITAPSLKSSKSGSRAYNEIAAITWSAASSDEASMASSGSITKTVMDWTIGATTASTDNYSVGNTLVITLLENVAGSGKAAQLTNATLTTDAGAVTQTNFGPPTGSDDVYQKAARLLTDLISEGTSAAETDTSADVYVDDARGDVIFGQAAEAGIDVTTGDLRVTFSRIHWLSS